MENISRINKKLLTKTKEYYKLKQYNIFHQTISLIISQKISFASSKKIRSELFKNISPDNEFTRENISKISKSKMFDIGIDENKYDVILTIINLGDCDDDDWINQISNIKGIGPWTIKCLEIMFDISNDLFLYEDLWIRKRLSELISSDVILSKKECNQISLHWKGYRTNVSKFFWRIKPEGITAFKNGENLDENHFL